MIEAINGDHSGEVWRVDPLETGRKTWLTSGEEENGLPAILSSWSRIRVGVRMLNLRVIATISVHLKGDEVDVCVRAHLLKPAWQKTPAS